MFPVLQIGPLAIQTPGLILIVGVWLGLSLSERHAPSYGLKADSLDNLVLSGLVAGILGARLGYVIQYPSIFFETPLSILSLNPGLLDPWTGLGIAAIGVFIYGQRKQLPVWRTLDALTPGIAVAAIALGFSHLASGAAFGMPTNVPWAIPMWGAKRHPSQVYEILAASLILFLFWPDKGPIFKRISKTSGVYFLSFMAFSALSRLFLEAFRGDSRLVLAGIRQPQVIAWLVLAATLSVLGRRKRIQQEPT